MDCIFLHTTNSGIWYAGKPAGIGIAPFLAAIWRYVISSLLADGIASVILRGRAGPLALPGVNGALTRIIIVSAVLALYLGAVILLFRGYSSLFSSRVY